LYHRARGNRSWRDAEDSKEESVLLQLAIDDPGYLGVMTEVIEFVDILEVGTPLLKRFGLAAIATVRERGEGRPVLVDTKTVDGGAKEARMVFGEGAAFMTVLSVASQATQDAVNKVAQEHDAHIVVDTICSEALPDRPEQYPDRFAYLALHAPTDRRLAGFTSSAHIEAISTMHRLGYRVAIAGGIGADNIAAVVEAAPEIVVVGSAITQAENPRRVAQWISCQLIDHAPG
jgi:3-hexulose-6-phosphate synthase